STQDCSVKRISAAIGFQSTIGQASVHCVPCLVCLLKIWATLLEVVKNERIEVIDDRVIMFQAEQEVYLRRRQSQESTPAGHAIVSANDPAPKEQPFELGLCSSALLLTFCTIGNNIPLPISWERRCFGDETVRVLRRERPARDRGV